MKKTLKKLMTEDVIFLDLVADSKNGIMAEIVDRLQACGRIEDRQAALTAVQDRERKMSTGIGHGIAIPHGKTDTVDQLVVAVGRKKGGVDFASLDGKPSTIFIFTLSPLSRSGPHLQFLAEVSKLLKDQKVRDRLLQAQTAEEVIDIFT